MTKFAALATICTLTAGAAPADTAQAIDAAIFSGAIPMEVAVELDALAAHGDRFAKAAALIAAAQGVPDWGWAACGHAEAALPLARPES